MLKNIQQDHSKMCWKFRAKAVFLNLLWAKIRRIKLSICITQKISLQFFSMVHYANLGKVKTRKQLILPLPAFLSPSIRQADSSNIVFCASLKFTNNTAACLSRYNKSWAHCVQVYWQTKITRMFRTPLTLQRKQADHLYTTVGPLYLLTQRYLYTD